MSNSGIEVVLASDSDYEELTVEIFYNGKFVALLNQDDGERNLKIEFPGEGLDETTILRKIDLAILEQSLELAKTKIKG